MSVFGLWNFGPPHTFEWLTFPVSLNSSGVGTTAVLDAAWNPRKLEGRRIVSHRLALDDSSKYAAGKVTVTDTALNTPPDGEGLPLVLPVYNGEEVVTGARGGLWKRGDLTFTFANASNAAATGTLWLAVLVPPVRSAGAQTPCGCSK